MPSTPTTRLRVEKQATGENNNTWGTRINENALDMLDIAVAGRSTFVLSGTKTLTSTNYVADESRAMFLDITSGTGGTVTIPAVEKTYDVRNNTSGAVVLTTGSGATASIAAGDIGRVMSDGTNVYAAKTLDYGAGLLSTTGTPSANAHLTTKTYVDAAVTAAAFGGALGAGVADWMASPTSANLITAMTNETGTGSLVFATSPTLVTPLLGTPTSATLTNCTGLPVASGISGLGTGVATFLATPSSTNLAAAVTGETGTGALVFAVGPAFTGTPTAPTASVGTNTTQIATTAFVSAAKAIAAVTSGTITGITDLAVADGGTGSSSAAGALANLGGLGITASELTSQGYLQLSNGIHLIWGSFSATGNTSTTYAYTTTNAAISLTTFSVAVVSGGPSSGGDNMPHVTSCTTAGFTVYNAYSSTVTTHFIAVGY